MNRSTAVVVVLVIWNIITFIVMGIDKHKAIRNEYRIGEKTLFTCAFFFGGLGIALGMSVFRHKTKHWSFRILVPLAMAVNAVLIYIVWCMV